ncbi:MAG: hypothetical protein OSA88_07870 [Acidimicrobiales bacterium]|nr:hypothetical protein [Acidimicrobiales bacterium]|tara:strand:+ start:415 stop:675 length:261 start_codon:yes stop_codon:yes gene_type:complete
MSPSGTEPGDFVEFDMDLIEADRRQRLRDALNRARPILERETGVQLQLANDGNDLVLTTDGKIRFRASLAPDGRAIVTDLGSGDLL